MEFLEQDRITKIRSIMLEQNNIDDFFLSFSGGKDSTVLSRFLDIAIPDNKVPRVFCDTGIEFNEIRNFVKRERERQSHCYYTSIEKHKRTSADIRLSV